MVKIALLIQLLIGNVVALSHESLDPSKDEVNINIALPIKCSAKMSADLLWRNWESEKIYRMEVKFEKDGKQTIYFGNMSGGNWELYDFQIRNLAWSMSGGMMSATQIIYKPEESLGLQVTVDSAKVNLCDRLSLDLDDKGNFTISLEEATVDIKSQLVAKFGDKVVNRQIRSKVSGSISGILIGKVD